MNRFIAIAALFILYSSQLFAQQNFRLVKSSGKLPMLAYGLGEDRLGGAKLGYIDSNVVLKIVDSTKEQFKVQLSKNRSAYIDRASIKEDSSIKQKPYYLTNAWSVKGVEDSFDIVSISMDEKLPYKTWMEVSPSKIMVELYGVQSNTNWIQQLQTAKEVKNIYFNQVDDDIVQVTIELKHQQHWGYTAKYIGKAFTIKIKHQPKKLDIKNLTIAIDAGHGGSNVGAGGYCSKVEEKEYTLLFAKALQKLLKKQKVNVIMTREKDTNIVNTDRVLYLQKQQPDLLVSIHLNSSSNVMAQGTSTYYKHIGFRPLSTAILQQMLKLDLKDFGNVGNFNFLPNAITDFPNALVEVAFLSNPNDERLILDPKFHDAVAKKIYLGIVEFLKGCK